MPSRSRGEKVSGRHEDNGRRERAYGSPVSGGGGIDERRDGGRKADANGGDADVLRRE
jgi:hypothetical protein